MSYTKGSMTLPSPSATSDLVNDSNFLSVKEYLLTGSVLAESDTLIISDLPANGTVTRVELNVTTAFETAEDQNNIDITGADSSIIMDADWNDPNTAGTYVTDCHYEVTGNILVSHDLTSITAGRAILKLFIYENNA